MPKGREKALNEFLRWRQTAFRYFNNCWRGVGVKLSKSNFYRCTVSSYLSVVFSSRFPLFCMLLILNVLHFPTSSVGHVVYNAEKPLHFQRVDFLKNNNFFFWNLIQNKSPVETNKGRYENLLVTAGRSDWFENRVVCN